MLRDMYIRLAWARIFIFKMEISCANGDSVTLEFMVCVYDVQQTTFNFSEVRCLPRYKYVYYSKPYIISKKCTLRVTCS